MFDDFLDYVQPLGTLKITKDEHCPILWDNTLNKWSHILIANDTMVCYYNTGDLVISNYPYLESFTVNGKSILGYINTLAFESTVLIILYNEIFLPSLLFLLLVVAFVVSLLRQLS